MSESSSYVPPFARLTRHVGAPMSAARVGDDDVDVEGDLDDDDDDGEPAIDGEGDRRTESGAPEKAAAPARVREGLPPSYRMRAEPHYVEALVDRALSAFEPTITTPTLVRPAFPAPVSPVLAPLADAEPAADALATAAAVSAAAATLADAFDAILAALRDVPLRGRPLRDRVAIELARAEATRGRWIADAAVVLQEEPLPALDEVDLLRLLAHVLDALGPENRLSGGAAAMPVPPGSCPVFGDERLLTTALGAILAAVRSLIEDRGDARKVTVAVGPRHEAATRTIEVEQSAVRLPASAYPRFFDADWADHPAGASGALLLAAARRIALAHGGGLEVSGRDDGGCRIVFSVPAAD